jgi:hypothetical protein
MAVDVGTVEDDFFSHRDDLGPDRAVVRFTTPESKRVRGRLAYGYALLKALRRSPFQAFLRRRRGKMCLETDPVGGRENAGIMPGSLPLSPEKRASTDGT